MPFREKKPRWLILDDFEPDTEHDPLMDLIEATCGEDKLYIISTTPGVWKVDIAIMPATIMAEYSAQKKIYASAHGVEVDQAEVGQPLLLSLENFEWVGIWRSVNPVTDLRPVQRHQGLRSSIDFPIERSP